MGAGAAEPYDEHDDPDSAYRRFERAVEWPMLFLSVMFVGLLLVPELVPLDGVAVVLAMDLIWAAFAIEVIVLAVLAPSKGRMLREHWLDVLIAAAPFLRPLRIGRILSVVRMGGPMARALRAVAAVAHRKGLQVYGAVALGVIVASGLLVYGLERDVEGSNITSVGDALWWALVTTTTVGYGDHFPVTSEGRALAIVLMFIGIGLVGVITANVAAYFVESEQGDELESIRVQLDRIEQLLAASDLTSETSSDARE